MPEQRSANGRAKRLYEMTTQELQAKAKEYELAGNHMWAVLCRHQIGLNRRIAEAFQRRCQGE